MLAASDPLAQGDRVRIEIIEWNVHQLFGIGSGTRRALRLPRVEFEPESRVVVSSAWVVPP